jgi:hypothetical protein
MSLLNKVATAVNLLNERWITHERFEEMIRNIVAEERKRSE